MNIAAECAKIYGEKYELDGILNPLLYEAAPIKILWLLREAWFENALSIVREEGVISKIGNSATLHPMAYVTYAVSQKEYPLWDAMDYLRNNPLIAEALRSIAYINVKKVPGGTSSQLGEIYDWFKRGESILKEQLAECRPDVVIGCEPYMNDVFRWDETRSPVVNKGIVSYVADVGKPLLIATPHPSQRRISRQIYVDTLIELIRGREALHIANPHVG